MSKTSHTKTGGWLLYVALTATFMGCSKEPAGVKTVFNLEDGWHIAAANTVGADGRAVSARDFDTAGWIPTTVPATPMAAMAQSGAVQKPYFNKNLEKVDRSQFEGPWWYRTEFEVKRPPTAGAWIDFSGINYSADVWLNGEKLADHGELLGAFRTFALDVTQHLRKGTNTLAVLVYPPQPGDPTIGFVDWNPTSPDKNMGLWRPVSLHLTKGVSLDQIFVRSDIDLETLQSASLTITALVRNHTDREIEANVHGTITGGIEVQLTEILAAHEEKKIELSPKQYAQLSIDQPRLWWPNGMGEPNLYDLSLDVSVENKISDRHQTRFGIRQVSDYINDQGHRGYAVNGKKVLIRGGGWVDDMMLIEDKQKIEDQIRYVKHMNLNTIRLEGFWGSSLAMYDLADRYGIMVLVGWSCQWEWENYFGGPVDEFGGINTPEEMQLVATSLADQVRWLRNHPSVVAWVLASDMLPRPELERQYQATLADVDTTRPTLSSCAVGVSEVSGPTGVKMNGPYDWVPPNYWYLDSERGGAYGFNTETGPGPQPPPIASIKRMLPEANWWPPDDMWKYHSGRGVFNDIERYREALNRRYGEPTSLEEFARIAQVANYEGMRAMFESFSIRRPVATGIIQWMLNSAWPEFYWQLYDYYLVPNGAFYGARDGSRPVNIAYDYANDSVVVVNETDRALSEAEVNVRVYDLDSQLLYEEFQLIDVEAASVQRALTLPEIFEPSGGAYFVDLRLLPSQDFGGKNEISNLYWLSAQKDIPDWDASLWFVTPMAQYADLTGLAKMARVDLDVEHRFEATEDGHRVHVTLTNPGEELAFFVELSVVGEASGKLAAPVLWSDNYVSLMPGETRSVFAEIPAHALAGEVPVFHYSGINVPGE
jgi:exo-1,4-beta-D-glucosaminidase